jgi:hypothetical protein
LQRLHEQDHHAIKHQLDDVRRLGQLLQLDEVVRLDRIHRPLRFVEEGLGFGEVLLGRRLLQADRRGVGAAVLFDHQDLVAFRFRRHRLLLQVRQHEVGVPLRLLQLHLLHAQHHLHLLHVVRALLELLEPNLHPLLLPHDLRDFFPVQRPVAAQEGEVRLGRLVHVAPKLREVVEADIHHFLVHRAHEADQVVLGTGVTLDVEVRNEGVSHASQSLFGPREEPAG